MLRRAFNYGLVGGVLGYNVSNHFAGEHWHAQDMYAVKDQMGLPIFRRRLEQDWPMSAEDMDRWASMGRNYSRGYGMYGAGAGIAAGVAAATRQRTPSPERIAYYDPKDPQTLHIPAPPETPQPPPRPRRLTREERDNERRRQIQPLRPGEQRRDPLREDFSRAWQTIRRGHL